MSKTYKNLNDLCSEMWSKSTNIINESNGGEKVDVKLKNDSNLGEWCVEVYFNGVLDEDKSYFTDDKNDAEITKSVIVDTYKREGYVVNECEYVEEDKEDKENKEDNEDTEKIKKGKKEPINEGISDNVDIYKLFLEGKKVKSDESLVNENILHRTKARASGLRRGLGDAASNVGTGLRNLGKAYRGSTEDLEELKDSRSGYESQKTKSIINSHLNKLEKTLSRFATDLVKLGVMEDVEAEKMAEQIMNSALRNRKLRALRKR